MSDQAPPSLAERIYGPEGPVSDGPDDPRTRAIIEGGKARPTSLLGAPPQADGTPPKPQDKGAPPPPKDSPFDPTKTKLPEGMTADPALMGEFAGAAKELGIGHQGAEKLMSLHAKAMAAQHTELQKAWSSWEATSKRDFGENLPHIAQTIRDAIGDDDDGKRALELLDWSGLGSEPAMLRVLHRLATSGRR